MRAAWPLAIVIVLPGCGKDAPTHSASPEEQSYEHAKEHGLTRDDAVRVSAPDEVRSPARIVFRIDVPKATKTAQVQVDLSGDCEEALAAGGRRARVQVLGGRADVAVRARVPAGASGCDVTVDALAPGRIDTGDGKTVHLRP